MKISLKIKNPFSYLQASLNLEKKESRSMQYTFPSISRCPVCGRQKCATWRGYYWRKCIFPEVGFVGKIAIRTGHCRRRKTSFSYIPDFLIPYRQISICSLKKIWRNSRDQKSITKGILQYFQDYSIEIPLSTLHSNLKNLLGLVRINVMPKLIHKHRLYCFKISDLLQWSPKCFFGLDELWLSIHLHKLTRPP